jgi:HD superfamily phosphohydrolase
VSKLFESRYSLYRDIYNHKTVHAVEFLLCDVLQESNGILHNYMEVVYDWENYAKLNDSILYEIEYSTDVRLEKAQSLIKRIKTRDYYKFVGEKVIPQ